MIELLQSGGFTMYVLLACSLIAWAVIFERVWRYRGLSEELNVFHIEAVRALLRDEPSYESLRQLCSYSSRVPTAGLVAIALDRLSSRDQRLRSKWREALERRRQMVNQDLRRHLWLLATIGSAAPFIGLFGTVVGILQSFSEIARTGAGGFAVVAGGISEALIATASGIVVALVSVMAYNAFQTRWSGLVLRVRLQIEEIAEILEQQFDEQQFDRTSGGV